MQVTCAGIFVIDFIAADLPKVSEPGEVTFTPTGIGMRLGGHSANVSIDLIKLGLKSGDVSSIGAVGYDFLSKFIEETLNSYGVITHLQKVKEVETSKNLILVVKGEDRRFHVDAGANLYLDPDYVCSILCNEKPIVFYVGAAGMLGKFDEKLNEVLIEAKKLKCLTFVDPIKPYKRDWSFLVESAKWIDIFHCNNIEAESITGKSDLKASINALINMGIKLTVVSLGDKGLIAGMNENLISMPAFEVPTVDPTGAGDAFCAGMIYKLIKLKGKALKNGLKIDKEELLEILLEGEAAGAACVTDIGTTTAVTRENVDTLLIKQKGKILKELKTL